MIYSKFLAFFILFFYNSSCFALNAVNLESFNDFKNVTIAMSLAALVIGLLFAIKRYNFITPCPSQCRLLEKKRLSPCLTVYVLQYKELTFLLAENKQSLTFQHLS